MNIGENIKKLRKEKQMTQKQLALKLNKSERMIQKYESGEVEPSLEILKELCKLFHVELLAFLGEDTYVLSTEDKLEFKKYINYNSDLIREIISSLRHENELHANLITDEDIDYFTESIKNQLISMAEYAAHKNFESLHYAKNLINGNDENNEI